MKKVFMLLAVGCIMAPLAAKAAPEPTLNYAQMYMVGAEGSTTSQTAFTLDQTPWLYLQLQPMPAGDYPSGGVTTWTWHDPTNTPVSDQTTFDFYSKDTNSFWVSLGDATWNSIKKEGNWSLDADTLLDTTNSGVLSYDGTTNFTVGSGSPIPTAPEPVSYALFIVGGLVMGAGILSRRQNLMGPITGSMAF